MLAGNIILVKIIFFVNNKAARGVWIFEKAKTTIGNQIVGFN